MNGAPPRAAVRKAVVLAAGLGTRLLPATKAIPKEMLPVVDRPAIQYVVEEAAAAGLTDITMVTARDKRGIEDHFDRDPELEAVLARKQASRALAEIRMPSELASISYVRQGIRGGVGHAVLSAEPQAGAEAFAVLLADDLIGSGERLLSRMISIREQLGGSVVALMEIDASDAGRYGCAAVAPGPRTGVVRVTDLVEKPAPGKAPSNYALIGRFILDPVIFGALRAIPPGHGGELQLTDALRELAAERHGPGPVHGVVFTGRRYDTGDKLDYLRSTVRIACDREDLGPEFRAWLRSFVAAEIGRPPTASDHDHAGRQPRPSETIGQ